jgi:alkanesulfonate monooxygenase SsuD/methylene tetrahydromethanopterin reductase-like flavin-dependent oxidoreductase (luciferase family)
VVLDIIDREEPTLRGLIHRLAGARGHLVMAGTPEQVADRIETWFTQGAADGFNVMPPWVPGGFELLADEVVPILHRHGLFRHEYTGRTLREHLSLSRPDRVLGRASRELAP